MPEQWINNLLFFIRISSCVLSNWHNSSFHNSNISEIGMQKTNKIVEHECIHGKCYLHHMVYHT